MKTLFNPKKPWLWILVALVAVAAAVVVFLLSNQPNTAVSAPLDACVTSVLREVHYSSHTEGKYPTVTYTALDVKETGDTATVYGVMMYREYTCTTEEELVLWGSAHFPFAITAEKQADGTYEATECWWPEDGAESNASIKEKFPFYCEKDAINYQQYFAAHDAACRDDAAANIPVADRYEVLRSERENMWLAYCPNNGCAYIASATGYFASSTGFGTDGTYSVSEDGSIRFTFGDRVVAFTKRGRDYVYDDENSENIPDDWKIYHDVELLQDGTRFSAESLGTTAAVGDTVLVFGGMSWMDDTAVESMFGYVPDNSHIGDPTASSPSDKPYYLPIKVLKTRDQLDQFLLMYGGDGQWTTLREEDFTQFDDTYFETNSLVVTYYRHGTYQAEPSVGTYVITEEGTCLSVRLDVHVPEAGDTAVGQWLLFSGIQKTDMEGIKVLEAYADNVTSEQEEVVYSGTSLSFTGKVTRVEGTAVLMESYDVGVFPQGVWVELGDLSTQPQAGEEYVVAYEDWMMPSLPPRITAISLTPKA